MRAVHHSAINVLPDRQRQDFKPEALSDLATSIRENGLLQPVVLRTGDVLVAGERRLRAFKTLEMLGVPVSCAGDLYQPGYVPCLDIGDLAPIEAESAELEENLRRVNLSWQEEERAIARLHTLRKQQHPEQSRATTAAELFPDMVPEAARQKVTAAVQLQDALASNPEVAKAKTRAEALKILKRSNDVALRTKLSGEATSDTGSRHTIVLGDCVEWLAGCPDATFDCIIIDPPYGMGADNFGDAAGRLAGIEHVYSDDAVGTQQLLRRVIPELFRVGKRAHHLYVWCDLDLFHWLRQEAADAGYRVHRTPLINVKREGGRVPWPEHGPRRSYEICLYATTGGPELGKLAGCKPTTAIFPDIFESTLSEGNFGHGAQKPVESYVNLLRRSCRPNDQVLDCFAGSGPLLDAAEMLQLKATLVEAAPHAHGIILERAAKLKESKA